MHCLSKSTVCFWRMYCACMGGTLLIHRLPSTTVVTRHQGPWCCSEAKELPDESLPSAIAWLATVERWAVWKMLLGFRNERKF